MHPRSRAPWMAAVAVVAMVAWTVVTPAAAATLSPALASEAGKSAVRAGDALTISGGAPAGATVLRARVLGYENDGGVVAQEFAEDSYGSAPRSGGEHLRVVGEALDGRTVLGGVFAAPQTVPGQAPPTCTGPDDVVATALEVTLSVAGSPQVALSPRLVVDYCNPQLVGHDVVRPAEVRARWSEAVIEPSGREDGADWTVVHDGTRYPVSEVRPGVPGDCTDAETRCARRLVLASRLPEDAVPTVDYAPLAVGLTPRSGYTDRGGNQYRAVGQQPVFDRVRPARPRVQAVDGAAVAGARPQVRSGRTRPVLDLSGVTPGHSVLVKATAAGGTVTESVAVATSGEATPTQPTTTAQVTAPELPTEGTYVLEAVAVDAGPQRNRSDAALEPARADGVPAVIDYAVDLTLPQLLSAVVRDGNTITVTFTEDVTGTDDPADFSVPEGLQRTPVLTVTGSGRTRTLTAAADVGPGAVLEYRVLVEGRRYRDGAGNRLADGSVPLNGIALPLVQRPAGPVVVPDDSSVVAGTAMAGSVVDVFRDDDGNGAPDGPAVASGPASPSFAITVPLLRDSANRFLVVARDPATGAASGRATVPRIVQDSLAPAVTLAGPAQGETLPGGRTRSVGYSYSDANPLGLQAALSLDGGASFTPLAPPALGGSSYPLAVPAVSTESAVLRLTGTDQANRTTVVRSPSFRIDAVPPALLASTVDARTVLVRLSETGVQGSTSPLDWRLDGQPVSSATQSDEGGFVVVRLATSPGRTIGPDEQPEVRYAPVVSGSEYRDRAGQSVLDKDVRASDGIRPVAPTVSAPAAPVLTRTATQRVTGTGTAGDRVELVDPVDRRLAGPVPVAADSTWTVDVALPRDSVNDLRAQAVDSNGNRSGQAAPVVRIEQDGTDPAVTVVEPQGGSRALGERVTVRWTSTDRNLQDGATLVQTSTDGGASFATLGERQPASGTLAWTLPSTMTGRALVRVTTPDRAGRTGSGSSGLIGVGVVPATPSPTGGSPAPSATGVPRLPLGIGTDLASTTPGRPAVVTVTGRPGTRVELQAYSRPSTTYAAVRSGVLDAAGRAAFPVRPGTNTRLFARALDRGQADSTSVVVNVRTALSLTVVRNGRRDYTFQGRILPRRAGQLITLYRVEPSGRRVIAAQLRTDATGTYRLRRLFTGSGRFGFLARTGTTLTNAAGESNEGRARPTDVF